MMDKLVPIRTIVGATGDHYSFQCMTGRSHRRQPQGGWPELGSVVAKAARSGLAGHAAVCRPVAQDAAHALQLGQARASWVRPMRRFSPTAKARTTWCCKASRSSGWAIARDLVRAFDHFNRRGRRHAA